MNNKTFEEITAYFAQPKFKNGYVYLSGHYLSPLQIQALLTTEMPFYLNALIDCIEFDIARKASGLKIEGKESKQPKILSIFAEGKPDSAKNGKQWQNF